MYFKEELIADSSSVTCNETFYLHVTVWKQTWIKKDIK